MEFDALARVVLIIKKEAMDQVLSQQRIFYDACGNKCREIHDQIFQGQKIGNNVTRWVYGPMGRIEEEIEAYGTDTEKKTTYLYNTLGQLTSKIVPGFSQPLHFSYHLTGELKSVNYSDPSRPENQQISNQYHYNEYGIIDKAVNELNGCCVDRLYNQFKQMTSETNYVDQKKYTIDYTYDRKGRAKTIKLPDHSTIAYTYDGVFCRKVERSSSEGNILYSHIYNDYDENGNLLREILLGQIGEKKYHYDLNGKVLKTDVPGINSAEKNEYDALGHIIQQENKGVFGFANASFFI